MTGLFGGVLTKRFTNPSSDVIEVLAGLDEIDGAVTALVGCIYAALRQSDSGELFMFKSCAEPDSLTEGLSQASITTAIALVSGAYQTGIVSYFTHRDLFPALMKASDIPIPDFQLSPTSLCPLRWAVYFAFSCFLDHYKRRYCYISKQCLWKRLTIAKGWFGGYRTDCSVVRSR